MRIIKAGILFAVLALSSRLTAGDKLPDGLYAEFTTPHGVFVTELFYQKVPLTVANFVGLAEGTLGPKKGTPYYTGLKWYRVVPGFVIQSGDPSNPGGGIQSRDIPGTTPGYTFPDELVPGLRHGEAGILSMANGGPDTNSAEFFLTLGDDTRLNYLHSVFGRVVRGLDVLPQIKRDDAFAIKILRVGAAARAFKADEATFKALAAKAVPYRGELEPGPTAHFDDPDKLLPQDVPRAKNFNYKLNNFQRFTGERIYARLFAKSPSATEDAQPGAFMHALAEKLGVAQRGAVAAYFADEDDWRVWIGDESTSTFLGRTSKPEDLVPEGAFHQVKEPFLAATRAAGDAAFAQQQKSSPPDHQPPPAQRLKLQTDTLLDALIFKLEPKSKN